MKYQIWKFQTLWKIRITFFRQRRSAGNQDLILLEESVSENSAFPNFDVLEALASESGRNPNTFSWVNIKYDDVIEVAQTNSQLIVRQKSGTTIDREIQNSHRLEFNVRDENTKERETLFIRRQK